MEIYLTNRQECSMLFNLEGGHNIQCFMQNCKSIANGTLYLTNVCI